LRQKIIRGQLLTDHQQEEIEFFFETYSLLIFNYFFLAQGKNDLKTRPLNILAYFHYSTKVFVKKNGYPWTRLL
jgi:hypothetical protein